MTEDQMREIACSNIERNLGDALFEDLGELPSTPEFDRDAAIADATYDSAYVLGFDALVDQGVDARTARRIAREVAQTFAQP